MTPVFAAAAWVLGPVLLVVGLVAFLVRAQRGEAEPLRAALDGWFPFGSATLCFERGGVAFSLVRHRSDGGGWTVLSARGTRPGKLMIGRAGSERFCAFGFPPEPVDRVERPGMKLITGCDEPALREAAGRLLMSPSGVSWGRLFPLDHSSFTWGPETHLGRGRVQVLKLLGVSPAVWTAPPTQFLGQVDALLKVARALELGLHGPDEGAARRAGPA